MSSGGWERRGGGRGADGGSSGLETAGLLRTNQIMQRGAQDCVAMFVYTTHNCLDSYKQSLGNYFLLTLIGVFKFKKESMCLHDLRGGIPVHLHPKNIPVTCSPRGDKGGQLKSLWVNPSTMASRVGSGIHRLLALRASPLLYLKLAAKEDPNRSIGRPEGSLEGNARPGRTADLIP